jgi:hypothetical protein
LCYDTYSLWYSWWTPVDSVGRVITTHQKCRFSSLHDSDIYIEKYKRSHHNIRPWKNYFRPVPNKKHTATKMMQLAMYSYSWWILVDSVGLNSRGCTYGHCTFEKRVVRLEFEESPAASLWLSTRPAGSFHISLSFSLPFMFILVRGCYGPLCVVVVSSRLKYQNCSITPFSCGLVRLKYQLIVTKYTDEIEAYSLRP